MDPPATLCLRFASLEIRMYALRALQSGDKLIKGHPDDKNTITGSDGKNLMHKAVSCDSVLIENFHKRTKFLNKSRSFNVSSSLT